LEKYMSISRSLTPARLAETLRRQLAPDWGPGYEPAMRATRSEAPSVSRASLLSSEALGRTIHAHSAAEQPFVFLALHHPWLAGFFEQRAMSIEPAAHPLQSHPLAVGKFLPSSSGTLKIASQLKVLHLHPKVWVTKAAAPDDSRDGYWAPAPWIDDHLLALQDEQGLYCVAWDIKAKAEDHGRPGPGPIRRRLSVQAQKKSAARIAVQERYHEELGIRISRVAGEQLNGHVANNLRALFGWSLSPSQIPGPLRQELTERFREGLRQGTPPIEVIRASVGTDRASFDLGKRVLYQAIFRREIRVDLFKPILVDRPLNPEVLDVVRVYEAWFAR
jgi:hypothetical protein